MREEVVDYTVGRTNVLRSWLDFRWADRDTRATRNPEVSSPLDQISHQSWRGVFDDDLLDILNVLTLLVELEPEQADLLDAVCEGSLLSRNNLAEAGALADSDTRSIYKPKVPNAAASGESSLPGT